MQVLVIPDTKIKGFVITALYSIIKPGKTKFIGELHSSIKIPGNRLIDISLHHNYHNRVDKNDAIIWYIYPLNCPCCNTPIYKWIDNYDEIYQPNP